MTNNKPKDKPDKIDKTKPLSRESPSLFHYDSIGRKVPGPHNKIIGDSSNISGDCTRIFGEVSDISGDVTPLLGNVSNLSGDVTGVTGDASEYSGDINQSKITKNDRKKGIRIQDIVK